MIRPWVDRSPRGAKQCSQQLLSLYLANENYSKPWKTTHFYYLFIFIICLLSSIICIICLAVTSTLGLWSMNEEESLGALWVPVVISNSRAGPFLREFTQFGIFPTQGEKWGSSGNLRSVAPTGLKSWSPLRFGDHYELSPHSLTNFTMWSQGYVRLGVYL